MGSEVIDQRALSTPTMFSLSHEDELETSYADDLLTAHCCTHLPPCNACHLNCLTPRVPFRCLHPAIQPSPYRPCSAGQACHRRLGQSVSRPRIRGIPQYCNNKRRLQTSPSNPPDSASLQMLFLSTRRRPETSFLPMNGDGCVCAASSDDRASTQAKPPSRAAYKLPCPAARRRRPSRLHE